MGALDVFLDAIPDTFDFDTLLDSDVHKIESETYERATIYKYYPSARRRFFEKPQVRFSQRDALNDRFEMSRRWHEIRADGLQNYIRERLPVTISAVTSNSNLLIEMLVEEARQHGQDLNQIQIDLVREKLQSREGQNWVRAQLLTIQKMIDPMVEHVFSQLESKFDSIVDNIAASFGILSLSEEPLSDQMWAHYGEQGRGFVVGLDAKHPFFSYRTPVVTRSLLKKVIYTDSRTQNFWRNPYYLFLVKSKGWSYEKEWRMLKKLQDSDESITSVTPHIHLWNLAPNIIQTIHFGYDYNADDMRSDIASVLKIGATPKFFKISVDRNAGTLQEHLIA